MSTPYDAIPQQVADERIERFNTRGGGWTDFAALMMGIVGAWNILSGILALRDSNVYDDNARFVFSNLHTWGWIAIIAGALLLFASGRPPRQPGRPLHRDRRRVAERDPPAGGGLVPAGLGDHAVRRRRVRPLRPRCRPRQPEGRCRDQAERKLLAASEGEPAAPRQRLPVAGPRSAPGRDVAEPHAVLALVALEQPEREAGGERVAGPTSSTTSTSVVEGAHVASRAPPPERGRDVVDAEERASLLEAAEVPVDVRQDLGLRPAASAATPERRRKFGSNVTSAPRSRARRATSATSARGPSPSAS